MRTVWVWTLCRLTVLGALSGSLLTTLVYSVAAQEATDSGSSRGLVKPPATTVKEWLAQIEADTVQVIGVKLERTETGLDIVLVFRQLLIDG